jgi:hypothetical protein
MMNIITLHRKIPGTLLGLPFVFLMLIALLGLAGCGSSGQSGSSTVLPTPPTPAVVQGYLGTQGAQSANNGGGVWQMSLDDADHTYHIALSQDLGYEGIGTTTSSNGVVLVGQESVGNGIGYAVEIPGRATLYRPAGLSQYIYTAPVVLVAQGDCLNLNGTATFQFVPLPDMRWNPSTDWAYGSVQASTSGIQWNFSNLGLFTQGGSSVQTPALQAGTCADSSNGNMVSILPDTANNIPATTIGVGPTGFFFADASFTPSHVQVLPAKVGVIQPTSALDTSAVTAAKYTGLLYEAPCSDNSNQCGNFGGSATNPMTELVVFGPGASGTLAGGAYPSRESTNLASIVFDLTQSPATNIGITLGPQDAKNNGLYKSASVTLPDPSNLCSTTTGTAGKDASGNPTCTVPAVAVVGNPESKYAIFLIAEDLLTNRPLGIYLYQQ